LSHYAINVVASAASMSSTATQQWVRGNVYHYTKVTAPGRPIK